jgi:hypothetical protein
MEFMAFLLGLIFRRLDETVGSRGGRKEVLPGFQHLEAAKPMVEGLGTRPNDYGQESCSP